MQRDEILHALKRMLPAELEEVIFAYGIPPEYLSSGSQTQRAIEIIRYAQSRNDLARLQQIIASGFHEPEPAPAVTPPQSQTLRADVALITAISRESKALLTLLREAGIPCKMREHQGRYYYPFQLPRDADTPLACVQIQPTDKGPHATAALIADLLHGLKPRLLLMVGVCAGFQERGVKLLDVLVARQVFNYERERLKAQDGGLQLPAYLCSPRWLDLLQALHNGGDLDEVLGESALHVCHYASGEKVLADSDAPLREQILRTSNDIRGLEMEGHGLLHAAWEHQRTGRVEVALLKCVSDLANAGMLENKDVIQEQAARKAAQTALAVLRHYTV